MILFSKYQNKNKKSQNYCKWYVRAKILDTVGIEKIAERICSKTTITAADVIAVLKALSIVMKDFLQDGYAVRLESIGTFRIGMKTVAADTEKDFTADKIVGYRVNFVPEGHVQITVDEEGHLQRTVLRSLISDARTKPVIVPTKTTAGATTDTSTPDSTSTTTNP